MASTDNVVINVRERPLSTDLNNLQSMLGRDLLDVLQQMMSSTDFGAFGSVPTSSVRNVVLNGLEVSPNGANVDVAAGILLQYSLTMSPALGSLDSPYRVGVSRSAQTLSMPTPGVDSWVTIEAQMVEVITVSGSRDILDPGTGNFVPTIVDKQKERQLQFQVSAANAGTVPAFSGGDWIPIAIVKRPAGGGAVLVGDIYDVRDLWSERLAKGNQSVATLTWSGAGPGDGQAKVPLSGASVNTITINHLSGTTRQGQQLWFAANAAVDLTSSVFAETGWAVAADEWRYLYLCPWRNLPVRNGQASGQGNSLLITSAVAPNYQLYNTGAITPPAPFSSSTIAAGEAVCVGAVWRNSLNTGWIGIYSVDGRTWMMGQPDTSLAILSPPVSGANTINLATLVPACARSVLVLVRYDGNGVLGSVRTLAVAAVGSAAEIGPSYSVDDGGGTIHQSAMMFEVPTQALSSTSFDLRVGGGAPNAATTAIISLLGWRM